MSHSDDLDALEALVRERMRAALADKAAFERDGQRLNSQLMQGELNMGSAVLAWIERTRRGAGADVEGDDEEPEQS
jgi:hypothetical protein